MTTLMGLGRNVVVMVGLFGTITSISSIRNVERIALYSLMTRTTILNKNTTISIGETEGRCLVKIGKMMLLPLAKDSVRQRKPSGKIRRKGKPKMLRMPPTKRPSVRKYSMSSMSFSTSRGRPRSRE